MTNEVSVNLGFLSFSKSWKPGNEEKKASWELYIELVTRIAIVDLPDTGLLREALASLHSIFGTTRSILKKYGPKIAPKRGKSKISFGIIAVQVLNKVLRPFLTPWHPLLLDYENKKSDKISSFEHEQGWEYNSKLRKELIGVRMQLRELVKLLEEVIGIDSLIDIETVNE